MSWEAAKIRRAQDAEDELVKLRERIEKLEAVLEAIQVHLEDFHGVNL